MSQSSDKPWDWRGLPPAPLPEDLKDIGTEELVRACQSMEDRLQRMTLLIEAMRELLQQAGLFSESTLREMMDAIDLRRCIGWAFNKAVPEGLHHLWRNDFWIAKILPGLWQRGVACCGLKTLDAVWSVSVQSV